MKYIVARFYSQIFRWINVANIKVVYYFFSEQINKCWKLVMNFYIYKISEVALTVKGVPLTNLHQNKSFHQIPESYSSEKFPLY
jgi:hypothetical protein